MKIFGYIPVRMASSRLPGKPLKYILDKTMLDHVYQRAKNAYQKESKILKHKGLKI